MLGLSDAQFFNFMSWCWEMTQHRYQLQFTFYFYTVGRRAKGKHINYSPSRPVDRQTELLRASKQLLNLSVSHFRESHFSHHLGFVCVSFRFRFQFLLSSDQAQNCFLGSSVAFGKCCYFWLLAKCFGLQTLQVPMQHLTAPMGNYMNYIKRTPTGLSEILETVWKFRFLFILFYFFFPLVVWAAAPLPSKYPVKVLRNLAHRSDLIIYVYSLM